MLKTIRIEMPSYALMTIIGIMAAIWFLYCRNEFYHIKLKTLLCSAVVIVLGMAVGSRIVFVISQIPTVISAKSLWWLWRSIFGGGFVFYGGLFGALFAAWLICRIRKKDTASFINYLIPGFPVFHFFGRIGCFLAGCCYGIPFPIGLVQPEIDNEVRIPVQLIEASYNLIIVMILLIWEEKHRKKGEQFSLLPVYLLMYAPFRFMIEFLRGDALRGRVWIFSTSQWISIITIAIVLFVMWRKKKLSPKNN